MAECLTNCEYSPCSPMVSKEATTDQNGDILPNNDGYGSDKIDIRLCTATASRKKQLILELSEHDVLLGRGTGPNECRGNIRLRALVRQALRNADLTKLDGKLKAGYSKEILEVVKSNNGLFVKAIPPSLNCPRRIFVAVSDVVALDKIKQSFRHQLRILGESLESKNYKDTSPSLVDDSPGSLHSAIGCASFKRLNGENVVSALFRTRELEAATGFVQHNIWPYYSQGPAMGGLGKSDFNLLAKELMMMEVIRSRLRATGATMAFPSVGATDNSMSSVVNAVAVLKSATSIRQDSTASIHIPSVNSPSLAIQNIVSMTRNQNLLATDLGLLETRLALARALSLSSMVRVQTAPPSALSVLDFYWKQATALPSHDA
jgi:hypothetical protein